MQVGREGVGDEVDELVRADTARAVGPNAIATDTAPSDDEAIQQRGPSLPALNYALLAFSDASSSGYQSSYRHITLTPTCRHPACASLSPPRSAGVLVHSLCNHHFCTRVHSSACPATSLASLSSGAVHARALCQDATRQTCPSSRLTDVMRVPKS